MIDRTRGLLILPLLVALGSAVICRAAEPSEQKVVIRSVIPSDTDSRIDKFTGAGFEHWIYYDPSASHRGELFVFLPGTGGTGHGSRALNTLAAKLGYNVVSLSYPSDVSMSTFHNNADPDCFLRARENVLYGRAPYKRLDTSEANSIENRLLKLLKYLAEKFPSEEWRQFVNSNGGIDWRKLAVAGQSQGGGHAGLIGMQHEVARVLMFGAPKDFNVRLNRPANWYSASSATPIDRFFSFVHSDDEGHGCTYAQQLENYRAMKLSPHYAVVNVDDTSAPYDHSHLLTSKRRQQNPHGSVAADRAYSDVWRYMLTATVDR